MTVEEFFRPLHRFLIRTEPCLSTNEPFYSLFQWRLYMGQPPEHYMSSRPPPRYEDYPRLATYDTTTVLRGGLDPEWIKYR